jgi:hypothetical protein
VHNTAPSHLKSCQRVRSTVIYVLVSLNLLRSLRCGHRTAVLQAAAAAFTTASFAPRPFHTHTLIAASMHDHESDDGAASEKDAVEVVVLQTATSWRAPQNQFRVRRSVAGEQLSQAGAAPQPQMPWIPAVRLPAAAVGKQRTELQQLAMVVVACLSWCVSWHSLGSCRSVSIGCLHAAAVGARSRITSQHSYAVFGTWLCLSWCVDWHSLRSCRNADI